jgi:hypothetical protein
MTCGRFYAALCTAAAISLSSAAAWAQGISDFPSREASRVDQQQPASAATESQVSTPQQPKPVPAPSQGTTPQKVRPTIASPHAASDHVMPQGFSVVLVLADLTASGAQDDVPPAARRALADMKDFLPYKSYKLLDAAWLLGQGSMSVRLRGPDEQEYELKLAAAPDRAGQVSVGFSLRESFAYEGALEQAAAAEQAARADVEARSTASHERQQDVVRLRTELQQAREKRDDARIRELQKAIQDLEREMAAERRAAARPTSMRKTPFPSRSIIDTSFAMDVGETVVVGTSRLRGNSRALIALLTAVPPSKSRLNEPR